MKLNSIIVGAALLVVAAVTVRSQNPAVRPAAATKVAVVSMRDALMNTADGRKALGEMRAKFDPLRADMEKRQKELQAMSEQVRKTTDAAAQQQLNNEIAGKKKTFDRDAEDLNNEVEQEDSKRLQQLSTKMGPVVDEYARKNGYTVVLDAAEPLLWAADSANITPDLIRLYDQKNGGAVAPSPAKQAAPGKK
ncbi:MAG: OmpH family outer membrane protein [Candidatus Solibacter sp.]